MNGSTDPTGEQIAAARLRVVLDAKLGRHTPERIWRLAGTPLSMDDSHSSSPVASASEQGSTARSSGWWQDASAPHRHAELDGSDLSNVERRLMELDGQGLDTRAIAVELRVTEAKVRRIRARVAAKTGTTSRDEPRRTFKYR